MNLSSSGKAVTNNDLCVYAMYLVGAAERPVDVEEIHFKLFDLAPKKFGCRTRPDIPQMRNTHTAFGHMEKTVYPEFVIKVSSTTRMLSAMGLQWVQQNLAFFDGIGNEVSVLPPKSRDNSRMVNGIRHSDAWNFWKLGEKVHIEDLAEPFGCSPASGAVVWAQRVSLASIAAEDLMDDELHEFLDFARRIIEEEG